MTEGKVMYLLLAFSLPIFIGNLFQQLYNVVDTVVIGHFLGDDALAAVGSTSAMDRYRNDRDGRFYHGIQEGEHRIKYLDR